MDRDTYTTQLDAAVAKAFGVSADIALLPRGSDRKTFRSGEVVLRYLGDSAASSQILTMIDTASGTGFTYDDLRETE